MNLEIIKTADGSNSLHNLSLHETYHSTHGAIRESVHVFIDNGLACMVDDTRPSIAVLEVGFGTGLNALLTMQQAVTRVRKIIYTAIDPYPLPEWIWSSLNYPELLNLVAEYRALHRSPWHITTPLHPCFDLLKLQTTLQDWQVEENAFDVIYYDAFAPSKQPELWELPLLQKAVRSLREGGIFVTYCAKGQVKRDLKTLRLKVETRPGPPGKKEMTLAFKTELSSL